MPLTCVTAWLENQNKKPGGSQFEGHGFLGHSTIAWGLPDNLDAVMHETDRNQSAKVTAVIQRVETS